MPQQEMKGIVRPPMEMPSELRERRTEVKPRSEVPLLIRLYTWLCAIRAVMYVTFGLIVGGAPDSTAAVFLTTHFDAAPKQASPEVVFYILAGLYALIAWRWFMRDWRARWAAMFIHGAIGVRTLINLAADRAAGEPIFTPSQTQVMILASIFNLGICAYLAFYPGMDQAFKETPWE
jgi:predicted permease